VRDERRERIQQNATDDVAKVVPVRSDVYPRFLWRNAASVTEATA
jgi:hypothetical protein